MLFWRGMALMVLFVTTVGKYTGITTQSSYLMTTFFQLLDKSCQSLILNHSSLSRITTQWLSVLPYHHRAHSWSSLPIDWLRTSLLPLAMNTTNRAAEAGHTEQTKKAGLRNRDINELNIWQSELLPGKLSCQIYIYNILHSLSIYTMSLSEPAAENYSCSMMLLHSWDDVIVIMCSVWFTPNVTWSYQTIELFSSQVSPTWILANAGLKRFDWWSTWAVCTVSSSLVPLFYGQFLICSFISSW